MENNAIYDEVYSAQLPIKSGIAGVDVIVNLRSKTVGSRSLRFQQKTLR